MKQLKFLKSVYLEGKPVWYKDCIYEVVGEGVNASGRAMYKLFCEDLQLRGIDAILSNNLFQVIEKEDKKVEPIVEEKVEIKENIQEEKQEEKIETVKATVPKIASSKKKNFSKN